MPARRRGVSVSEKEEARASSFFYDGNMGRLDVLTVLECRMTKTRGRVVENALRYITEIETCSPWMS